MNNLFVAAELPIYSISGEVIKLPVVLKPQAKNNKILGVLNGRLKIAINATPVNGMANKELIAFMAKLLVLKKCEITIMTGLTNPLKLLSLPLDVQFKLDEIIKNNS